MVQPYPLPRATRETAILNGNGGATYGPFQFKIFDTLDVKAFIRPQGADFFSPATIAVAKTSDEVFADFTVTFPAGVPSTTQLLVKAERLHERQIAISKGGGLSALELEKELSKQGSILDELRRDVNRGGAVAPGSEHQALMFDASGRVVPGLNIVAEASAWRQADALLRLQDTAIMSLIGQAGPIEVPLYDSRLAASLANIKSTLKAIRTAGFYAPETGGGALYVEGDGNSPGGFFSNGGMRGWRLAEDRPDVKMYGARGGNEAGDGAILQTAFAHLGTLPGVKTIIIPNDDFDISDVDKIVVPSRTIIHFEGGRIRQRNNGNTSAFVAQAGATDIALTGKGQIIGPAENRDPAPGTAYQLYPNQNAGIKLLGTFRRRVEKFTVERGIHIWGWDVSGIFPECTKDCVIDAEISKCGVDGIRWYGDINSTNNGAYIHDIYPGFGGTAEFPNAYGVTATRRQQRTNRFTVIDDIANAAWTKTAVTATNGSQLDPYTLSNTLGTLTETATTSGHSLRQNVSTAATAAHFGSAFFEYDGTCPWVRLRVDDSATPGNFFAAHFNIQTGTKILEGVGGQGQLLEAGIEHIGDSRYRAWVRGRAATSGSGVARLTVAMLGGEATSIGSGASYAGSIARGIRVGGLMLVDNNFFQEFGSPRTVNPPSRRTKIGCRIHNVPSWAGHDTHGGEGISMDGGYVTRCRLPFNVDEGDTSGTNDSRHRDTSIDGVFADAEDLVDTAAGICVVGPQAQRSRGVHIDNVTLRGYGGPSNLGEGQAQLGHGAILVSFVDEVTIGDNVHIYNPKRAGVVVRGDCDNVKIGAFYVTQIQDTGDGVQVPLIIQSAGGFQPVGVRALPPRRAGVVSANYITGGGSWVQGGRYIATALPTPPNSPIANDAWVMDDTNNRPLWYIGSAWRDATGVAV